jgi:hypothetical protein
MAASGGGPRCAGENGAEVGPVVRSLGTAPGPAHKFTRPNHFNGLPALLRNFLRPWFCVADPAAEPGPDLAENVSRGDRCDGIRVIDPPAKTTWPDGLPFPSPFLVFSMACGAIPESLPALRLIPKSRSPLAKCESRLSAFLKNNIETRPAWQEIVDFSWRTFRSSAGCLHCPSVTPTFRNVFARLEVKSESRGRSLSKTFFFERREATARNGWFFVANPSDHACSQTPYFDASADGLTQ